MKTTLRCTFFALLFGLILAMTALPLPEGPGAFVEMDEQARPAFVLECPPMTTALFSLPGLPGLLVVIDAEQSALARFDDATPAYAMMDSGGRPVPLRFPPLIAPFVLACGVLH